MPADQWGMVQLVALSREVAAKASVQRLADGIQKHVIDGLCKLL